ncbi:aminoacyl-tRNA hydrolase [Candidatus Wolfebacteria bacterium]|nr:aminoacyl-tRNA hydrolase [Candidatus Wolfebacteria bacterium]
MWLLVGLGNPGDAYAGSRHNIGFMVLEALAKPSDWTHDEVLEADIAKGRLGATPVLFLKPQTFMNISGRAVGKAKARHKIKPEHIIVVHDDIDLPLGALKITFGRGSGGHRGVESVVRGIRTKNFTRVRVGVTPTTPAGKLRKPRGDTAVTSFIVGVFKKSESEIIKKSVKRVASALEMIVTEGRQRAMNGYN